MKDPFSLLGDDAKRRLERAPIPGWVPPMLATLRHEPFSDPEWIFERKLDGIRCLAFKDGSSVRLFSRNQLGLERRFPELAPALARQQSEELVVDGEIVAFEGRADSFARLQRGARAVHLYVFDLLFLQGYDLRQLPLLERKRLLRAALEFGDPLHFVSHHAEHGERLLQAACKRGWEGVIGKRADSTYHGGRSRDWLKLKCSLGQELVIGGYTEPRRSRTGFGALLVGYFENGALHYAGKVGTGFDGDTLRSLSAKLSALELGEPAFDVGRLPKKGVHWVKPELVCEVGFSEWTRDGRLRHPTFRGLRFDKPARSVVRERPI
jgi:DNA ligase D-like protein (predicted ligase)